MSEARRKIENDLVADMRRLVLEFNDQLDREIPDPPTVDRLLGMDFEQMVEDWKKTSTVQHVVAVTWPEAAFGSLHDISGTMKRLER